MFFIQVGSHTGQSGGDHVKPKIQKGWSGILIEPVKYLFERLKKHYGSNAKLILENVAIDAQPGKRTLYRIDEKRLGGLPCYADQLGTFLPELIEKRPFADRMIEEEVECITFDQLIEKHKITHADLLAIDVEGMDYAILKTFPFEKIKPPMLIYEEKHLSEEDRQKAIDLIKSIGYGDITEKKGDIIAQLSTKTSNEAPR